MPIVSNTIEGVTQIMRKAVEAATGLTTLIGPVQGPEPANQFCIITLMNNYKQPHDVIRYTQTETTMAERQRGESTLTFEVQARGKDAMDKINSVASFLDSELRDIDLWPYVGSGGHTDAQYVGTYYQGKMLEIAVMNIDIHANITKQNALEWMNFVDIDVIKDNNVIASITVPEQEHNENGEE